LIANMKNITYFILWILTSIINYNY